MNSKHYHLAIDGMQCADCEHNIETAVLALPGVIEAKADFARECLDLDLDSDVISVNTVYAAIKRAGYACRRPARARKRGWRFAAIAASVLGIALLLELSQFFQLNGALAQISENADYGLLFLVGVLTSFHCIGMCGGLVLSYTVGEVRPGRSPQLRHFYYGLGKLISYSAFGALFGLIGGAASFTATARGLVSAAAGTFLLIYGLGMLDAFRGLRRFQIRLPRVAVQALAEQRRHASKPLLIGLLNGLMIACGPLQAMYILAAGTGSPARGAAMLAVFALGTLPVMFAFGYLAQTITATATRSLLKVSSLIIIVLGLAMVNRGLLISGGGYDAHSLWSRAILAIKANFMTWRHGHADVVAHIQEGYQVIYTEVERQAYLPGEYTLRANLPVKWILNVKELSTCNRRIVIPALAMTIDLKPGLQLVEFTPKQTGVIGWSCYMGMIPGTFIVKD